MALPAAAIAAISGGAAQAGSGLASSITAGVMGDKNLKFGKEQFEYQKELNKMLLDRSDNQLQYMVRDASKAGINPLAALGSSNYGNTNGVAVGDAPKFDTDSVTRAMESMKPADLALTIQDVLTARSAENLNSANALKATAEAQVAKSTDNLVNMQVQNLSRDVKSKDYNLGYASKYGQPYGYGADPKNILGTQAIKQLENGISTTSGIADSFIREVGKGARNAGKSISDSFISLPNPYDKKPKPAPIDRSKFQKPKSRAKMWSDAQKAKLQK